MLQTRMAVLLQVISNDINNILFIVSLNFDCLYNIKARGRMNDRNDDPNSHL